MDEGCGVSGMGVGAAELESAVLGHVCHGVTPVSVSRPCLSPGLRPGATH